MAQTLDNEKTLSYLETNEITADRIQYYKDINSSLLPLTKKQKRLIQDNPGALESISRAAHLAIKECQFQFQNRRWNCPVKKSEAMTTVFGKILDIGKFSLSIIVLLFIGLPSVL